MAVGGKCINADTARHATVLEWQKERKVQKTSFTSLVEQPHPNPRLAPHLYVGTPYD